MTKLSPDLQSRDRNLAICPPACPPACPPVRLTIVQYGDYAEAAARFQAGGAANYYAQRYTVDFVARLAGDEFMVILQDIGDKNAVALIADRLVESCREPISLAQQQVRLGVSIGISFFPTDADTVTALMSRADQAMYRAKETGGGCYVCYGQEN